MSVDVKKPIIAVFGYKKSGKTKIIEKAILNLSKKGFKIAVIKHIHDRNFNLDVEGKDTWRFTESGAKITVGASDLKIVMVERLNGKLDLRKTLDYLKNSDLDVIFLEGFKSIYSKDKNIYKIIMARNMDELRELYELASPPIIAISGNVAENTREFKGIPVLDLRKDISEITKLIEKVIERNKNH